MKEEIEKMIEDIIFFTNITKKQYRFFGFIAISKLFTIWSEETGLNRKVIRDKYIRYIRI